MNAIKHPVKTASKFAAAHPIAATVIATTTTVMVMQHADLKKQENFLKAHGLYETFRALTD